MGNLWIFGDSYSCPWKNVVAPGHREYAKKYNPTHFTDVLSSNLPFKRIINKAVSGSCNYSILQSICENINKIKKTDTVIIGWSEITRWRSLSCGPKWRVIGVNFNNPKDGSLLKESVSRDNKLVVGELSSWINLLDLILPTGTIHWTPFQAITVKYASLPVYTPPFELKRISQYTDIKDAHCTGEGHKDIGEWLIKTINSGSYKKDLI